MVKQTKFLRKQTDKADQFADRTSDPEVAADLRAIATAYRSQADVLKKKRRRRKTADRLAARRVAGRQTEERKLYL
jgi:hypothetical protein